MSRGWACDRLGRERTEPHVTPRSDFQASPQWSGTHGDPERRRRKIAVEMTAFEAFIRRAALREVLYGPEFPDFEARMVCSRGEAAPVLEALPRASISDVDGTSPERSRDAAGE